MSNRKELKETSRQLKDSIEDQFDEMREKVTRAGKIGLWVGGGLLAVLILSNIFSGSEDEEEDGQESQPKKKEKKKKKRKVQLSSQPNFLSDTLKEQAILFGLGLAAKQLKTFLSDLKENNGEEDSE